MLLSDWSRNQAVPRQHSPLKKKKKKKCSDWEADSLFQVFLQSLRLPHGQSQLEPQWTKACLIPKVRHMGHVISKVMEQGRFPSDR